VDKRDEFKGSAVRWEVAMRPGKRRALDAGRELHQLLEKAEKLKASIRAKVEHPFRIVKQQFGYAKVRYHGLAKNTALCNLWMRAGN
jgi:IS5 family transposase